MKVEGSNVPVVILHKVKVKEESKDESICDLQQQQQQQQPQQKRDFSTLLRNGENSQIYNTESTLVHHKNNNNIKKNDNSNSINVITSTAATSIITSVNNSSIISSMKIGTIDSQSSLNESNIQESGGTENENKGGSSQKISESKNKLSYQENNNDLHEKENRLSPTYLIESKQSVINERSLSDTSENKHQYITNIIKPENDQASVISQKSQENSFKSELNAQNDKVINTGPKGISSIFTGHTKLKRLLGTLVQFANNISTETGNTVRNLILGLLNDGLSAEEFHTALQEVTNFPLRDFVLPYLKHTLPSLRRNINAAAVANNQTCVQYLQSNESAVLETVSLMTSGELTVQLFNDHKNATNYGIRSTNIINSNVNSIVQQSNFYSGSLHHHYSGGIKRRAPDTLCYENSSSTEEASIYAKRSNNLWNQQTSHQLQQQQHPQQQQQSDSYCWYHPVHSSANSIQTHSLSSNHGSNLVLPNLIQINHSSSFGSHQLSQPQLNYGSGNAQNNLSLDDEWKNIHVMLNCILGMVEKTKRALLILQKRGCSSPAASSPITSGLASCTQNGNNNSNNTCTNNAQVESSTNVTDRDNNLKRLSGEIVAQTIRATEDRVAAEVKRRAEEAVQEVKRAAMIEIQRAVAAAVAESRVNEKFRSHQLFDVRLSQKDDVNSRAGSFLRLNNQSKGNVGANHLSGDDEKEGISLSGITGSICWNCGRPALETCGGCGIAKYCSSFCQHRDWETGGHHATCHSSPSSESKRSMSRSPPRIVDNVIVNAHQININDTHASGTNKTN